MTDTKLKKDKIKLAYRVDSIEIVNHSEKNFSEYGLKKSQIKNGDCEIGLNIQIDPEKGSIAIPIKVVVHSEHEGSRYELFSNEVIYTFKVKNFKEQLNTNEQGQYDIPDTFMRTLIGATVGGMRGIMVALTTIDEYKKIILPLIDTSTLFEVVKKAQSSVNQP